MRSTFAACVVGASVLLGACGGGGTNTTTYTDTLIDDMFAQTMVLQMGYRVPGNLLNAPADSSLIPVLLVTANDKIADTTRHATMTQWLMFDNPGSAVKEDGTTPYQAGELWDYQIFDDNITAMSCATPIDVKERFAADEGVTTWLNPTGPRYTSVWATRDTSYAEYSEMLNWLPAEGDDVCATAPDTLENGGPAWLYFWCPESGYLPSSVTAIEATRSLSKGVTEPRIKGWCEPKVDLTVGP